MHLEMSRLLGVFLCFWSGPALGIQRGAVRLAAPPPRPGVQAEALPFSVGCLSTEPRRSQFFQGGPGRLSANPLQGTFLLCTLKLLL